MIQTFLVKWLAFPFIDLLIGWLIYLNDDFHSTKLYTIQQSVLYVIGESDLATIPKETTQKYKVYPCEKKIYTIHDIQIYKDRIVT